jgi:hypothetical protein
MDASTEVCPVNIGPKERHKRLVFGVVFLAVGIATAATLVVVDVPRPWRLAVFLPFSMGAVGVFQAREKT